MLRLHLLFQCELSHLMACNASGLREISQDMWDLAHTECAPHLLK